MIHFSIIGAARKYSAEKENRRLDPKQNYFDFTGIECKQILKNRFIANKNQIESYYRTIFNIVEMIELNPFIDKKIYINILTSQLSRIEIMMLYYYGILEGNEKEKDLIERYAMLKDIDRENMIFPELMNLYDSQAFEN
ncbi:putative phage abortive infection protein [Chryseobacterium taiwanense]|uniref:Uncharacterized protein n=1 Tax=Chryseobacterium taiwanense TaxID=363331 RepID=A0A0B4D3I5_9FLAO|nr:putative phage abortive infection protein [Chryseobacterium taiwanense]KIC63202.1 hypothetical protein RM51_09125 [Chryseobacterium taiwanense]